MKKPLDTLELLKRLQGESVEFVIIGGIAALAHGGVVPTQDLDVCAPLDHDNAARIIRAFAGANPRWRMRPDLPVITPDNPNLIGLKNLYLRTDLGQLDVLGEVPNVCTYAELKQRSVEMDFAGLHCRVIDVETLIAAKRSAGRPHDLRTIAYLEEAKRRTAKQ